MQEAIALDCKGLACPGPVLRCKEAIESNSPQALDAFVDNEAAKQNVTRFLQGKGYDVVVEEQEEMFILRSTRTGDVPAQAAPPTPATNDACGLAVSEALGEERVVAFITSETIGSGDDELGAKLMLSYLTTLPELGSSLWRIILVNGAVKLATKGHAALEKLQALEAAGVSIIVCGTCLDHFGILDDKRAGETTNMLDVVTSLQMGSKVLQV